MDQIICASKTEERTGVLLPRWGYGIVGGSWFGKKNKKSGFFPMEMGASDFYICGELSEKLILNAKKKSE